MQHGFRDPLGSCAQEYWICKELTCIKYLSRVNILTNSILCVLIFFLPKKKKKKSKENR